MTKEEFCEYANVDFTEIRFCTKSEWGIIFDKAKINGLLSEINLADFSGFTFKMLRAGDAIHDMFSKHIHDIGNNDIFVAYFKSDEEKAEYFTYLPDARIFTVVLDDCGSSTETICKPTTYQSCMDLIKAKSHNKIADYVGGVAYISSVIPEIADEMGQGYFLTNLN